MVSQASIAPHSIFRHGASPMGVSRRDIALTRGRVSDALRVFDGPCVILSIHLEITEAVSNTACNMSWVLRSDQGGGDRVIGDVVDIANAAPGDLFYAELDGTNIVKATTGTGLVPGGFNGYQHTLTGAVSVGGYGTIVTEGGIDLVLSATPAAGQGSLYVYYKPLIHNACLAGEDFTYAS